MSKPATKRSILLLLLTQLLLSASAMPSLASTPPAAAWQPATAQPAEELPCSYACESSAGAPSTPYGRLSDGSYLKAFEAPGGQLTITPPQGKTIGWAYVCFAQLPAQWQVEADCGDGYAVVAQPQEGYHHAAVQIPNAQRIRITATEGALRLHEVRVFAQGALPDDVQVWQPTPQKADLMLLTAHPDDEVIFFGGLVPYYVHRGKTVLVACATCQDDTRRAELLNALWCAGLRQYPVIGPFRDRSTRSTQAMYDAWTREEADCWLVTLLRKHQPEVLVTHDVRGEYGHGAHMACADMALRMFSPAADALYLPQVTRKYGAWQVKKLYLHLWREGQLRMDWTQDAGGEPAIGIALRAFEQHKSQQHFHVQCREGDLYDCALFGLARSTVGEDRQKDDFFENIP